MGDLLKDTAKGGMLGTMGTPTGIMALGSALSLGTKFIGAEQQKNQVNSQMEQEKAANAARGRDRAKQLNQAIGRQAVMSGAKGMGAGSSVFRQVSQDSFDSYHEDQARDNLNLSFQENALRSKISAIDAQEFGDLFSAGTGIAEISFLEDKSKAKDSESSFFNKG